jgi:hypothetical protein
MSESSQSAPTPRNEYGWIAYFAFLIIASVGVTGWMIYFNLSIQLKPEELTQAHQRWKEHGPRDYTLVYTQALDDDPTVTKFVVKVRAGEITEMFVNGKAKNIQSDLPMRYNDVLLGHSMDDLFRAAEHFMEIDQRPDATKVYVTALFDPKTGGMLRYVRRVMGTKMRIERKIELQDVDAEMQMPRAPRP